MVQWFSYLNCSNPCCPRTPFLRFPSVGVHNVLLSQVIQEDVCEPLFVVGSARYLTMQGEIVMHVLAGEVFSVSENGFHLGVSVPSTSAHVTLKHL